MKYETNLNGNKPKTIKSLILDEKGNPLPLREEPKRDWLTGWVSKKFPKVMEASDAIGRLPNTLNPVKTLQTLLDFTGVPGVINNIAGNPMNLPAHEVEAAMIPGVSGIKSAKIAGITGLLGKGIKGIQKIIPKKFNFNPEAYYRVIGNEEGLNDLLESGFVRPNQSGIFADRKTYFTKGIANDSKNPVIGGGAKKGTFYKGKYIVEVSPGENFPKSASELNSDWNFGYTEKGNHIPANSPNVKILKKDWLRGYKQVNPMESYSRNLFDSGTDAVNSFNRQLEYLKNKYKEGPLKFQQGGKTNWLEDFKESMYVGWKRMVGPGKGKVGFESVDLDELLPRQAFKESSFLDKHVKGKNSVGAIGIAQIKQNTLKDYPELQGMNLRNPKEGVEAQRVIMEDLLTAPFIDKPYQPDSVTAAKALAAYNWGRGNLVNYLNTQKKKGVDIHNSWNWLNGLPTETRDYVNKILRNKDPKFEKSYKNAEENSPYMKYFKKGGKYIPSAGLTLGGVTAKKTEE